MLTGRKLERLIEAGGGQMDNIETDRDMTQTVMNKRPTENKLVERYRCGCRCDSRRTDRENSKGHKWGKKSTDC